MIQHAYSPAAGRADLLAQLRAHDLPQERAGLPRSCEARAFLHGYISYCIATCDITTKSLVIMVSRVEKGNYAKKCPCFQVGEKLYCIQTWRNNQLIRTTADLKMKWPISCSMFNIMGFFHVFACLSLLICKRYLRFLCSVALFVGYGDFVFFCPNLPVLLSWNT